MRWTLTSPDGLGDFILRLPWLFAMQAAGWKLQLVCRPPTAELANLCGLRGEKIQLSVSPYSKTERMRLFPFRKELKAVRRFKPDVLFLGPSHPTFFEEQAVRQCRGLRVGGFRLDCEFWPSEGLIELPELAASYNFYVNINEEDSEPVRNAKAAAHLLGLGQPAKLQPFRFDEKFLHSLSPKQKLPERFIAVCAGQREGDYFQGWGSKNWARELSALYENTRLPLVFVGSPAESTGHEAILQRMGSRSIHQDLTGQLESLRDLCAILKVADAYVGKDCGTMHISAAMGLPVLSVFGGGHRDRFHPVGTRSAVLTVDVPCRGCDWRCHLEEPLCVRDLSHGKLLEAWRTLSRLEQGQTAVMIEPVSRSSREILERKADHDYPARMHQMKRAKSCADRRRALFWAKPFIRV